MVSGHRFLFYLRLHVWHGENKGIICGCPQRAQRGSIAPFNVDPVSTVARRGHESTPLVPKALPCSQCSMSSQREGKSFYLEYQCL